MEMREQVCAGEERREQVNESTKKPQSQKYLDLNVKNTDYTHST